MANTTKKIQTAFTGGELSPRMLARVDLDSYDNSAKTMENFIPMVHGGAKSRAGTVYAGELRNSAKPVRLIPFVFSNTQSYVLVLNDGYVRFLKDNAYIMNGGSPYEITHPYADSELPEITYAQNGNILILAQRGHAPTELLRASDTSWSFNTLSFVYNAVSDTWYENNQVRFKLITAGDGFKAADSVYFTTDGNGNAGAPVWTVLTGTGDIATISVDADTDVAQTWTITCTVAAEGHQEFTVTGSVSGTLTAQWTTNDYPNAVTFWNQRLFFAGSNSFPQRLWTSVIGEYDNLTIGPWDSDGIQVDIASNTYDEIMQLESARVLLPLTYSGEFSLTGGSSGLTPSAIGVTNHTSHGINNVKPQRVDQEVLFVQRDGLKVRAISYDVTLDTNIAPDITLLAEHITEGGIVDMTFAQYPNTTVWAVRADGTLLSLTHLRFQEVTAWARHITQGSFVAVTNIPSTTGETTYTVVEREIDGSTVRYIEYFDYDNDVYTDSSITVTGSDIDTWTGLDHLEGETVRAVVDGRYRSTYTVTSGSITTDISGDECVIGLGFEPKIELLHPEVKLVDGTSQGRQLRIVESVVRLQDTVGLTVNGQTIPFETTSLTMDAPTAAFTGDKKIPLLGWNTPNNVELKQELPMPITILGVIFKVAVGES